jgi:hypothetical protein
MDMEKVMPAVPQLTHEVCKILHEDDHQPLLAKCERRTSQTRTHVDTTATATDGDMMAEAEKQNTNGERMTV